MHPLIRHKNADQDLLNIVQQFKRATGHKRKRLKGALGRIAFILEAMETDEDMQKRLLKHSNDECGGVNFKKWLAQHKLGNDLWRVKLWSGPELVGYRIIYAYEKTDQNHNQSRFHVLAIVDRNDFNYEDEHQNLISARIINDYSNM